MLKQILEQYCAARGIVGEADRDSIASSILHLFDRGLTDPDEITSALEEIAVREVRRKA